jgi:hypothetical protein
LRESLAEFIDQEYLPEGAEILEPTKMQKDKLNLIFQHWHVRQADGKVALKFKSARDGDKEKVKKTRVRQKGYVDPSDAEASSNKGVGPSRGRRGSTETSNEERSGNEVVTRDTSKVQLA